MMRAQAELSPLVWQIDGAGARLSMTYGAMKLSWPGLTVHAYACVAVGQQLINRTIEKPNGGG